MGAISSQMPRTSFCFNTEKNKNAWPLKEPLNSPINPLSPHHFHSPPPLPPPPKRVDDHPLPFYSFPKKKKTLPIFFSIGSFLLNSGFKYLNKKIVIFAPLNHPPRVNYSPLHTLRYDTFNTLSLRRGNLYQHVSPLRHATELSVERLAYLDKIYGVIHPCRRERAHRQDVVDARRNHTTLKHRNHPHRHDARRNHCENPTRKQLTPKARYVENNRVTVVNIICPGVVALARSCGHRNSKDSYHRTPFMPQRAEESIP
ncbi:hypothetical protein AVEN_155382-1 [Araneus ventricosus]|uniref:Uncharacterized protein n=1 Tax=Araneus ventricosus TaxID=182803 RepID=A0A4Y2T9E5_ARAVE|nr:hypothetical protein AVEN_24710-1 [Araneus ventricosus]GBN96622.1 hypothetical protein AVEN_155382-1 [Araneus ventricosus]